jgi:hypothetical protein
MDSTLSACCGYPMPGICTGGYAGEVFLASTVPSRHKHGPTTIARVKQNNAMMQSSENRVDSAETQRTNPVRAGTGPITVGTYCSMSSIQELTIKLARTPHFALRLVFVIILSGGMLNFLRDYSGQPSIIDPRINNQTRAHATLCSTLKQWTGLVFVITLCSGTLNFLRDYSGQLSSVRNGTRKV